jgi:hypothetical protein
LLVAAHRPRHDIATGIGDDPLASVGNILPEGRLIQKFQDEISVIQRASAAEIVVRCPEYSRAGFRSCRV